MNHHTLYSWKMNFLLIITGFFVNTLPVLNNPFLDHVIYVNESFDFQIPVDLFYSNQYSPIKYSVISTGHDFLNSYEMEPEIVGSIFDEDGSSTKMYRYNDKLVAQDGFSIKLFDVSDPYYLRLVSIFKGSDLNGEIFAFGDYVYLALETGKVQKYDFSDLDNPVESGSIDLSGVTAILGKEGVLFVLSQDTLFCLNTNTMEELGSIMIYGGSDSARKIVLEDDIIYAAGMYTSYISAIDVSDPVEPFIDDFLLVDDLISVSRFRAIDKLDDVIHFTGSYLSNDDHFYASIDISLGLSNGVLTRTYELPNSDDNIVSMSVASNDLVFLKVNLDSGDIYIRILNNSVDPPEVIYDIVCGEKTGDVNALKVGEQQLGEFGAGEVVFFCDEEKGIKVYDVRNLDKNDTIPEMIGWSDCKKGTSQFDVEIDREKAVAYLSSDNYFADGGGFRVVNISDPSKGMKQVGWYPTELGNPRRYKVSNKYDVLYSCHFSDGVKVLNIRTPNRVQLLSTIPSRYFNDSGEMKTLRCNDVGLNEEEDLLFILLSYSWEWPSFTLIYNVSNKLNPVLVGEAELGTGNKYGILVTPSGNKFYVFNNNIYGWNASNLSNIVQDQYKSPAGNVRDGVFYITPKYNEQENFTSLIVASIDNMDILDPSDLNRIPESCPETANSQKVVVGGRYAFFASSGTGGGVMIVDLKNISNPTVIYEDTTRDINGVSYMGNYVFLPDEQVDGFHALKFNEIGVSGTPKDCGNYEVVVQADDNDKIVSTSFFIRVRRPGFYDDYCEVFMCPGEILSNDTTGLLCNGNGVCEKEDQICDCFDGYYGSECEIWTCNGIQYTSFDVVCNGRGECNGLNRCHCDPTEDEVYEYIGIDCGIRIGKQILRATKNLLILFFEISIENLKENYDLEVDKPFECSRFIDFDGFPLFNCSLSSLNEFFQFPGFTQFLKIQVDHLSEEEYFELLEMVKESSLSSSSNNGKLVISSTFSNHTKTYSGTLYPALEDLMEFKDTHYTMKSFSQGVVSEIVDLSQPLEETQFCKQKLFMGEDCILIYECYESMFEGQSDYYKYYSIGFIPSTELDESYYLFSKFYFPDRESCESGTEISNFKTFAAVSCYGSHFGDNFFMYSKCSDQLFSIFFDSNILSIFVFTASPIYILLILVIVLSACCCFNAVLYCSRYTLKKCGIYKLICPWYYGKSIIKNKNKNKKKNNIIELELMEDGYQEQQQQKQHDDIIGDVSYENDHLEQSDDDDSFHESSSSVMSEVTKTYVKSPSSEQLLQKGNNNHVIVNLFNDAYDDDDENIQIIDGDVIDDVDNNNNNKSSVPVVHHRKLRNVESVDLKFSPVSSSVGSGLFNMTEKEHEENSSSSSSSGSENSEEKERRLELDSNSSYSDNGDHFDEPNIFKDVEEEENLFSHFENLVSETNEKYQSIIAKRNEKGSQLYNNNNNNQEVLRELCEEFSKLSNHNLSKIAEKAKGIIRDPSLSAINYNSSSMNKYPRLNGNNNLNNHNNMSQHDINNEKIVERKMKKNRKGVLLFKGKNKSKGRICQFFNIKSDFFCFCCRNCCCMNDLLKTSLFILFIILKDGLALWFSSSEFLSNADIDRSNKDYVTLTTVLSFSQWIIWVSIFLYVSSLVLFILLYVERFMFDPLMFCVSYGSLKEFIYFRVFKAVFMCWFICINLFCYIVKFWYLDSFEKRNELVSPLFYLSIILPEGLLIFKLISELSYNGVSSFSMYKRMKNLGLKGFCKFPKVNITYFRCAMECDVILEDFFQLLFLLDLRSDAENKGKIVSELGKSEEYGHLSWEYLRGLSYEEMLYMRKFFFPKEMEEEDYCSVFKYHKISSPKWIIAMCIFPFLCCFGSNIL